MPCRSKGGRGGGGGGVGEWEVTEITLTKKENEHVLRLIYSLQFLQNHL